MIKIEVVFATPELQKAIALEVAKDCTLQAAILQSQIARHFPDYALAELPRGIFGKRIFEPEQYVLKDGDRIEIYRPLTTSPNQKRLDRAKNK